MLLLCYWPWRSWCHPQKNGALHVCAYLINRIINSGLPREPKSRRLFKVSGRRAASWGYGVSSYWEPILPHGLILIPIEMLTGAQVDGQSCFHTGAMVKVKWSMEIWGGVLPPEYKLNTQGDNIQSWHIPCPIWNQSVVPCLVLTVASWLAYRFLRRQVMWSGIPILGIFHSLLWSTQSMALAQSMKQKFF